MLGTNDIERAARFYDQLLGEIGAKRFMEADTFIAWATSPQAPVLSVTKPFDGNPATVGNGTMVALAMDSRGKVDGLYRKAIELGASSGMREAAVARFSRPAAISAVDSDPSVGNSTVKTPSSRSRVTL